MSGALYLRRFSAVRQHANAVTPDLFAENRIKIFGIRRAAAKLRRRRAYPAGRADSKRRGKTKGQNDEPIVMLKVVNSTAEPDGTFKDYFLRVPPRYTRARDAWEWTWPELASGTYELVQQT